eukprot:CAMPEP_0182439286 /NCGR_PEP_ID=MMETSP1167-20130531/86345_1 /TAXON_ID=2988 /ORGANISM="Mallomonas Sp, Strain CCMP3275" /LENGTH=262 /DNA_ID=CAMNT_0024632953 /DNA_START=682 /DNA_END=1467 /DNA_ORIENTATION=-
MGMDNRAVSYATEALRRSPGHPAAVRYLAMVLWHRGYHKKALDYMISSTDIPEKSEKFSTTGARVGTAPRFCRHRENPFYQRTVGIMQGLEGQYEASRMSLLAAMSSAPAHHHTLRAVAIMTYLIGENKGRVADESKLAELRTHAAIKYLDRALLICPEDVEALRLKGQMLMELSQWDVARVLLQRALRLSPEDTVTMGSLAICADAVRKNILRNLDSTTGKLDNRARKAVRGLEVPSELFEDAMLLGEKQNDMLPSDVIFW